MKNKFCAVLIVLLLISCGTYKSKKQIAAITFPELGSIIKNNGKFLYKTTEQIGFPVFTEPLKVTVQQIPFTKAKYKVYASVMEKGGKINSVISMDSIPVKPMFMRLQLADKIQLTNLLNTESNIVVANYLQINPNYKIVTTLDFVAARALQEKIKATETILLEQDQYKNVFLTLGNGNSKEKINLSRLEIFDFSNASFCWGENKFYKKEIKTILSSNKKCPAGTYKNAAKVVRGKSYLKF